MLRCRASEAALASVHHLGAASPAAPLLTLDESAPLTPLMLAVPFPLEAPVFFAGLVFTVRRTEETGLLFAESGLPMLNPPLAPRTLSLVPPKNGCEGV